MLEISPHANSNLQTLMKLKILKFGNSVVDKTNLMLQKIDFANFVCIKNKIRASPFSNNPVNFTVLAFYTPFL